MSDAILLAIGGNILDFIQSEKNDEVLRRLFIQECRYNLSVLSLSKWKDADKSFNKHLARNLKFDVASMMHCKYNNDFFHFTTAQFRKILQFKDIDESISAEVLLQLVNKTSILKFIADIPIEMSRYDKSNIEKRISNLRNLLSLIIQILESKKIKNKRI